MTRFITTIIIPRLPAIASSCAGIDIFYVEKENPERITLHGYINK